MSNSDFSNDQGELSPKKRALFELLLEERRKSRKHRAAYVIPERPDRDSSPLSFSQQRMWFLDRLEPESSSYNLAFPVRLRGRLDVRALEASLNEIVSRHEILRTNFKLADDRLVQFICAHRPLALPVFDLRNLPAKERYARADQLAEQESRQPFDLTSDPLIRATLLLLSDQEHRLILTMHHIVSDAWSIGILVREVARFYDSFSSGKPSTLPPLPLQYADFAHWQRQWLQGEVLEKQLAYWKKQFAGSLPVLQLPFDRPRPPVQTYRGATKVFFLAAQSHQQIKTLVRREEVTMFMLLMAAFQTLLYRYSGQPDIAVGTFIANRKFAETEGLIGLFANTLVMRTDLSGNPTFRDLLGRVRQVALDALAHQDVPFEKLVEELQPKRDLSYSPLFQVAFMLQNAARPELSLSGLTIEPLMSDSGTAKFDLTMTMAEEVEGRLTGAIEYNTDLFNASTIARMLGHFQTLLEAAVADPQQRIADLPLLTKAEKDELTTVWSGAQADYASERCVHQIIESQAVKTPDAVAIEFAGQQLSYDELNRRANRLARHLRSLGVGCEQKVALLIERSAEMIVGMLAILKAGGAYVPLDPAYPSERIATILENSRAQIVLTQTALADPNPNNRAQTVCIDSDWPTIALWGDDNLVCENSSANLAYAIYTSGSTGTPKGVQISHQSVVNFLTAMRRQPGLGADDVLLSVTTISFDIAALEIFLPLSVGGRVSLVSREVATNGGELIEQLRISRATVMQATPATWLMLLESGWEGRLPLKILCGGEALTRELANKLTEKSACVWNLFGPTETTIWSTAAEVESGSGPVVIGRPIDNTEIYLLDGYLHPVPLGLSGELYIAGDGLARGYQKLPDLTAATFMPNPFSGKPGARMYRAGDTARFLEDGKIEYIGRIDNQVKIRGYRIEPGEIEAVVRQHRAVQEGVVLAQEEESGERRLIAYVVRHFGADATANDLRGFLKERLPAYMIPSSLILLDAMPLTPNGKIDRQALSALSSVDLRLGEEKIAPRIPIEKAIAGIWENSLGVGPVSIRDSFFDIGGHSLLAMRLLSQLQETFGVDLQLRELFESPSVTELAIAVVQRQAEQIAGEQLGLMLEELERLPDEEACALLAAYIEADALTGQLEASPSRLKSREVAHASGRGLSV
jgi:amino acid adenylation domain-containing protein